MEVVYLVMLKPLNPSATWHQMLFRTLAVARDKWLTYQEYVVRPDYEYIGANIVRVDFDPDSGVGSTTLIDSYMPVRKTVKEYHKNPPTKVEATVAKFSTYTTMPIMTFFPEDTPG